MELRENGKYALVNTKKKEIVAISDDYQILIQFMNYHRYICRDSVVRELKKKVFDEMLIKYDGLYLVEFDNIVIRQQDIGIFLKLKDEEAMNLSTAIMGIQRVLNWDSLKNKEKSKLEGALQVLYKYFDDEKKLLKKSGISDMCSDIYYLDNLRDMEHRNK